MANSENLAFVIKSCLGLDLDEVRMVGGRRRNSMHSSRRGQADGWSDQDWLSLKLHPPQDFWNEGNEWIPSRWERLGVSRNLRSNLVYTVEFFVSILPSRIDIW